MRIPAAYGFFLVQNHPFVDANKRTAAHAMEMNRHGLAQASNTSLYYLERDCAGTQYALAAIADPLTRIVTTVSGTGIYAEDPILSGVVESIRVIAGPDFVPTCFNSKPSVSVGPAATFTLEGLGFAAPYTVHNGADGTPLERFG